MYTPVVRQSYISFLMQENTPKQIRTGLFVHQVSRNKTLVDFRNSIGETIHYRTIFKIDTIIA